MMISLGRFLKQLPSKRSGMRKIFCRLADRQCDTVHLAIRRGEQACVCLSPVDHKRCTIVGCCHHGTRVALRSTVTLNAVSRQRNVSTRQVLQRQHCSPQSNSLHPITSNDKYRTKKHVRRCRSRCDGCH